MGDAIQSQVKLNASAMTKRPRIAVAMQSDGASKTASKEILAEYWESSRGVMNEFPRGLTEARKATTIKALEA